MSPDSCRSVGATASKFRAATEEHFLTCVDIWGRLAGRRLVARRVGRRRPSGQGEVRRPRRQLGRPFGGGGEVGGREQVLAGGDGGPDASRRRRSVLASHRRRRLALCRRGRRRGGGGGGGAGSRRHNLLRISTVTWPTQAQMTCLIFRCRFNSVPTLGYIFSSLLQGFVVSVVHWPLSLPVVDRDGSLK